MAKKTAKKRTRRKGNTSRSVMRVLARPGTKVRRVKYAIAGPKRRRIKRSRRGIGAPKLEETVMITVALIVGAGLAPVVVNYLKKVDALKTFADLIPAGLGVAAQFLTDNKIVQAAGQGMIAYTVVVKAEEIVVPMLEKATGAKPAVGAPMPDFGALSEQLDALAGTTYRDGLAEGKREGLGTTQAAYEGIGEPKQ